MIEELPMSTGQEQQAPAPAEQPGTPPMSSGQGSGQSSGKTQSKGPFPADEAEAKQFSNDLLQIIYDKRTHGNILKQLSEVKDIAIGKGVGLIAGHLVGNRVADVRGQTGRKLEMRLVVNAVKAVIRELAEIADGEGLFSMGGSEKKEAFGVAISVLDQMGGGRQQQ